MTTLEELIEILTDLQNLDPENRNAEVQIYNKYIIITRQDQDDGYYLEIK